MTKETKTKAKPKKTTTKSQPSKAKKTDATQLSTATELVEQPQKPVEKKPEKDESKSAVKFVEYFDLHVKE